MVYAPAIWYCRRRLASPFMCDLHRRFVLCSCSGAKIGDGSPSAFTWTLRRHGGYIGPDLVMEGVMAMPSRAIGDGLTSTWVEAELNARSCFDFDFEPHSLDELKIRGGPGRHEAPDFLSFVFHDGRWRRDMAHGFADISSELSRGRLEFGEKTRFNTLRSEVIVRLRGASPPGSPIALFLSRLLYRIEAFDGPSFEADGEQLLLLLLEEEAGFLEGCAPSVRDELLAIERSLVRAVSTPVLLPNAPLRRSLGDEEVSTLWMGLLRALGDRREFVTDPSSIARWKERMAEREIRLYNLSASPLGRNHELSSAWVASMFTGDDSHWISANFSWAIHARRDGHHEVRGDLEG